MKIFSHILFSLLLLSIGTSCKKGFDSTQWSAEEIGRYVSAKVPAVIDPGDPVRIRFAVPVDTSQTTAVYAFHPDIQGVTYWEDHQTLAFQPNNGWTPATDYQVQINLDKIISDV